MPKQSHQSPITGNENVQAGLSVLENWKDTYVLLPLCWIQDWWIFHDRGNWFICILIILALWVQEKKARIQIQMQVSLSSKTRCCIYIPIIIRQTVIFLFPESCILNLFSERKWLMASHTPLFNACYFRIALLLPCPSPYKSGITFVHEVIS